MFNSPDPNNIENWTCVKQAGTEYEIEMAKNYLTDQDIPANKLSKRDTAYSLNVGDMAMVYLYVPDEYAEQARRALEESGIEGEFDNEEE